MGTSQSYRDANTSKPRSSSTKSSATTTGGATKGLYNEYKFSSLNDMVNYIESNKAIHNVPKNGFGNNPYTISEDKAKFTGGTYEQCIQLMKTGDNELLKKFVAAQSHVQVTHTQTEMIEDVVGSFVNMDSYIQGLPECMFDFQNIESNRFCEITINTAFSSETSHSKMFEKYIYVVKLIDLLESSNVRCKVIVGNYSEGATSKKPHRPTGNKCDILVTLKEYSEQLSLAHLLFCCCNPMFLRIATLCVQHVNLEAIGFEFEGCCFGYESSFKHDIYINSMYSDKWNYNGTQENFQSWCNQFDLDKF